MSIMVSAVQNLLYSSLYQLTIYLHNVWSERFGKLAHSEKFAFLAAYTLLSVILHLYCFYALKAMTTESKFGKISQYLHSAQTKLYDVHSVFISKDRTVTLHTSLAAQWNVRNFASKSSQNQTLS